MNDKIKPAVIGGVVLGLLSVIPIVNWVNFCCCLWAIAGGVLAAQLYIKNSPTQVSVGEGAMLGAIAGVIGGAIYVVVGVPVNLLVGGAVAGLFMSLAENFNPEQADMIRRQMMAPQNIVGEIVRGFIGAIFLVIFSTVGGLLAIPIFEKRKAGAPPPPPSYGS
jgi:hypothetical protein